MDSRRESATRANVRFAVFVTLLGAAALASPPRAGAQAVRESLWVTNGDVYSVFATGGAVYLGGRFTNVAPATGPGVVVDAATGAVRMPYPKLDGRVYAVVSDGAGGWYVGGDIAGAGGQPRTNLVHFDAGGVLDPWNPSVDGPVRSLALIGGVLYAGGDFLNVDGEARSRLAAFQALSGDLTSWNPGSDNSVLALAPGGTTLYAGGEFATIGGAARSHLAELDLATGLATSWNPNLNGRVNVLMRGPLVDDLCVGGAFTQVGAQPQQRLAAFDVSTGALAAWAPSPNQTVYSLGFSGDDVYVGGVFTQLGGFARANVGAVSRSTGVATAWNPAVNGAVFGIRVVTSGTLFPVVTVYLCGGFDQVGGATRNHMAAVGESGSLASWNPSLNATATAMDFHDGAFFVGGSFTGVGGAARQNLAAFDVVSGALLPWAPTTDNDVNALTRVGSRIILGGSFTSVNGVARQRIAAVDSLNGLLATWNPGVSGGSVLCMASLGTTLYIGGSFTTAAGVARNRAAAIDASTGAATAFDPNVSGGVSAMAVRGPDTIHTGTLVYLGGAFSKVGGQSRSRLAAVDGATGGLSSWTAAADGNVQTMQLTGVTVLSNGTLYIGGDFLTVGGQTRHHAASLDGGTAAVGIWNPDVDAIVYKLQLAAGMVYLAGGFTSVGGAPRDRLAAVTTGSGAVQGWNPRVKPVVGTGVGTVFGLAVSNGTVFAGGSFVGSQFGPHAKFAGFTDATVTAVEAGTPAPPAPRTLVAAPNPTASGADVEFSLARAEAVIVDLFDVRGRRVRRLQEGVLAAGPHRIRWDGRGEGPTSVPSGVYFLRLETEGGRERRATKVLVLR